METFKVGKCVVLKVTNFSVNFSTTTEKFVPNVEFTFKYTLSETFLRPKRNKEICFFYFLNFKGKNTFLIKKFPVQ